MWNPGAKVILGLYLLTVIYLTVTDCRLLPRSPARRAFERKRTSFIPSDIMKDGSNLLNSFKIPNRKFCSEMILRPEDHYLVLPWWYNYCQDLKEKYAQGIEGNINYNTVHKYILAEAQLFKKRLNEKDVKMSALEKELIAFNHG